MTVGVVGLGLIGASFAKAYSSAGHKVLAYDIDESVTSFATVSGDVFAELNDENVSSCDLILICIYPEAAIDWVEKHGAYIGKKPVVIDCCGTKRVVVGRSMKAAEKYGFTYVGGHPMAGTQYSGYKYAKADLYQGAPMVIVPEKTDDPNFLSHIKELLAPAGFAKVSITTAEKHDEIIAFTSQLAHLVSNAYIKSPTARSHFGVSAGSYKDMTRVARLNPEMWAQLFLENKDNLIYETETLINNLSDFLEVLKNDDREGLVRLLEEGSRIKKEVDGE